VRDRPLSLNPAATADPPNSRDATPLSLAVAPIIQQSLAEPRRSGVPFTLSQRHPVEPSSGRQTFRAVPLSPTVTGQPLRMYVGTRESL
jgi:hypothetical protein